jgi:PAS domain-containing protein
MRKAAIARHNCTLEGVMSLTEVQPQYQPGPVINGGEGYDPLQRDDYDEGREKIAGLIATVPGYQELFGQMMEVVRGFVPFDWAYLFVFTEGRAYSSIACRYGPDIPFLSRWFKTTDGYRDWITTPVTWADDLKTMIEQGPDAEELLKIPDLKIWIEAGFKALVALPVQQHGDACGALVLYSKQKGQYNGEDRKKLERLMLGQALLPVLHAVDKEESDLVSGLMRKIATADTSKDLAQTVCEGIARAYGFKNVSIFKVDALSERLRLLHQASALQDGTSLPRDHSQPLTGGLLGEAYRREDYVLLKNVADGSREAQIYVRTAPETRSELCIPIKLSERILWILNLEDTRIEAFNLGDVETLKSVIDQIQINLDRIFQRLVLKQVLDVVPEAVIITKQSGEILHCTKGAVAMLEYPPKVRGANLFDFLPGADFSTLSTVPKMGTVVGANGKRTPVLTQKFKLDEEYDYVVLVLQDFTELQWKTDRDHLRAAVAETAAQVRVPISLLSSFVQQIGQKVKDKEVHDLVSKSVRQLGRVELTYDRVLASYQAQTLQAAQESPINVKHVLDYLRSELPTLEGRSIRMSIGKGRLLVNGDPYRVVFALGSMLAYLLRSRGAANRIAIKVQRVDGAVEVSMTGAVYRVSTPDDLADFVEAARRQIALGEDTLARIAKEYGGNFDRRRQGKGRERLSLRLAAAQ